jgi:uncharacterized protein (TIGR02646 family)
MRSIPSPTPHSCLTDLETARPNGPWFDGFDQAERSCRRATRDHLLTNQGYTCGWCEAQIDLDSSHAEHIQPKSNTLFKHLTFSIQNLIACCGKTTSPTCGHQKGERVLADWIHSYHTADLQGNFTYEIDGEITPHSDLGNARKAEADEAIDNILNLNETVLKSQRESLITEIVDTDTYQDLSHDEIFLIAGEFKSVIEQFA